VALTQQPIIFHYKLFSKVFVYQAVSEKTWKWKCDVCGKQR